MVHSWNLKKQVNQITPLEMTDDLDSWRKCREFIALKKPLFTKKLKNWAAQIMYKKLKSNQTTLFDNYYAKLLLNKNPKKWDKFELLTNKTHSEVSAK